VGAENGSFQLTGSIPAKPDKKALCHPSKNQLPRPEKPLRTLGGRDVALYKDKTYAPLFEWM